MNQDQNEQRCAQNAMRIGCALWSLIPRISARDSKQQEYPIKGEVDEIGQGVEQFWVVADVFWDTIFDPNP